MRIGKLGRRTLGGARRRLRRALDDTTDLHLLRNEGRSRSFFYILFFLKPKKHQYTYIYIYISTEARASYRRTKIYTTFIEKNTFYETFIEQILLENPRTHAIGEAPLPSTPRIRTAAVRVAEPTYSHIYFLYRAASQKSIEKKRSQRVEQPPNQKGGVVCLRFIRCISIWLKPRLPKDAPGQI